jgi:hypothetical protein
VNDGIDTDQCAVYIVSLTERIFHIGLINLVGIICHSIWKGSSAQRIFCESLLLAPNDVGMGITTSHSTVSTLVLEN